MPQTHHTPRTWVTTQFAPQDEHSICNFFPPFRDLIARGDEVFPHSIWTPHPHASGWGHKDGQYVCYGIAHRGTDALPYPLYSLVGRRYPHDADPRSIQERTQEDRGVFMDFVHRFHHTVQSLEPYGLKAADAYAFAQEKLSLLLIRKQRGLERVLDYLVRAIEEPYAMQVFAHTHYLDNVPEQFPCARGMKRQWTLYVGPTNSGKTWHAMRDLIAAGGGTYLAPLRLMALEGQEKIQAYGVDCSLRTGEERQDIDGAMYTSSTIEMLNTDIPIGACIIDEVQILNDPSRGWAWTRALMGAPAHHIIMTGSPDAIPTVERMAARLGEPLTIVHLERKTELSAEMAPTSLDSIKPGDAIIAFGRRQVLELKALIEATGRTAAVLYGALGPEVRRAESLRFSTGEADVVVATDVIGMGLNLPIKRVLFSAMTKFNGEGIQPLTDNEIRQIGGRAGRYGHHETGMVGVLEPMDTEACITIKHALSKAATPPEDTRAQAWAPWPAVDAMAQWMETDNLRPILEVLYDTCLSFDPDLVVGNPKDQIEVANILDISALPLATRYNLLGAPLPIRSQQSVGRFLSWLGLQASDRSIDADHIASLTVRPNSTLEDLESASKMLVLYDWMVLRFPEYYTAGPQSRAQRTLVDQRISEILRQRIA